MTDRNDLVGNDGFSPALVCGVELVVPQKVSQGFAVGLDLDRLAKDNAVEFIYGKLEGSEL